MTKTTSSIHFKTKLLRPAEPAKATWTFLILPKAASGKLPTRSMTTVDGTLGGAPFQATLEPDGKGSHWLKVDKKLREAAGAKAGDEVALEISPVEEEPEPKIPADLRKALADTPEARTVWKDITPVARRDWVHWITSPKRPETRVRRIETACDKLASGQRRACCFDRSGMYSNSLAPPRAAKD
ncbi:MULTISPECIES: YdeI/OmpD-associated family protein [unclassified Lysobacter]